MTHENVDNDTLFLGIDGGGSKSRATLVAANGDFLGTGVAGPANPFQDSEQAFNSVLEAARLALVDAGINNSIKNVVAGVGLAGVNLPRFYAMVSAWQHPFKHMFLATDLHIACLSAHEGRDGAVVVAGTGSCGYSYVNGQSFTCGAHGFPFGDKGSGAWMGLEAFKATLLASDGLGPATSLQRRITQWLEVEELSLMIEKMAGSASNQYAKLAPLVFAAAADGDAVASEILEDGAAYLGVVCKKLWQSKPPRMSLLGGLSKYIEPWLDTDIAARLSPALQQPEYGAICFARREWQALVDEQTG